VVLVDTGAPRVVVAALEGDRLTGCVVLEREGARADHLAACDLLGLPFDSRIGQHRESLRGRRLEELGVGAVEDHLGGVLVHDLGLLVAA
jgi:hypothetical protein